MLKGNCSSAKFKRPQNRCRCVKGLLIDRCEHSNFKAIPKFNNGPKGHGLQIADCRRKDKHTSPGREVFLPLFSVPVIDKGKSGGECRENLANLHQEQQEQEQEQPLRKCKTISSQTNDAHRNELIKTFYTVCSEMASKVHHDGAREFKAVRCLNCERVSQNVENRKRSRCSRDSQSRLNV